MKWSLSFLLAALAGCAVKPVAVPPEKSAEVGIATPPLPDSVATTAVRAEVIRTDCISGRRLVCGKVLKIFPDGLVVDSGYTDLLRAPLAQSWVVPGSVSTSRNATVLELNEPGTPCVGLVFLTDIPKRQPVKELDYVIMMGYPAGTYIELPAPGIEKTIRKFSCGLDTAVRLKLAEEKPTLK